MGSAFEKNKAKPDVPHEASRSQVDDPSHN